MRADDGRSNPFIAKMTTSPSKAAQGGKTSTSSEDMMSVLREGMGRMDIASRSGSGEYKADRKESKDTAMKGRDVSDSQPSLCVLWEHQPTYPSSIDSFPLAQLRSIIPPSLRPAFPLSPRMPTPPTPLCHWTSPPSWTRRPLPFPLLSTSLPQADGSSPSVLPRQ